VPGSHRGLPYPNLDFGTDTWTSEERADTLRWYELAHGYGSDTRLCHFVPWQIDHNPAGFKRYRATVPTMAPVVPRGIFAMHMYVITQFGPGLEYEIVMARNVGWTKNQIIELLNFATVTSGPPGMNTIADSLAPYLAGWDDDRDTGEIEWPEGWYIDPDILKSGIPLLGLPSEFPDEEVNAVAAWHKRMFGDEPRFVREWAGYVGGQYKALRARFEVSAGTTIAAQVYPLLLMHAAAFLERPTSVVRHMRWAKTLGVTREQVVEVLNLAFFWGLEWKMASVLTDEVLDELAAWDA
jgi:alkylhydroperoxidase/carboxymuconolactone decarboxylase family protein YurZ